jgi:hypothetical protein
LATDVSAEAFVGLCFVAETSRALALDDLADGQADGNGGDATDAS